MLANILQAAHQANTSPDPIRAPSHHPNMPPPSSSHPPRPELSTQADERPQTPKSFLKSVLQLSQDPKPPQELPTGLEIAQANHNAICTEDQQSHETAAPVSGSNLLSAVLKLKKQLPERPQQGTEPVAAPEHSPKPLLSEQFEEETAQPASALLMSTLQLMHASHSQEAQESKNPSIQQAEQSTDGEPSSSKSIWSMARGRYTAAEKLRQTVSAQKARRKAHAQKEALLDAEEKVGPPLQQLPQGALL